MANTKPHKALPKLPEQSVLAPINANNIEINFARRVEILKNGCWLWHGSFSQPSKSNSYIRRPLLWSGEKVIFAHRYAYESRVAELPDQRYFGLERDCSTELCVNPRHFTLYQRRVFADDARPMALAKSKAEPMCKNQLHERTPENTATIKTKNGGTRTTCKPCLKKSASEAHKRFYAKKKLAK